MTRLTIIGLLFIFLTLPATGQENQPEKYPIDKKLEQCLAIDSNQTTAVMTKCTNDAEDEWDKELNKYYQLLMDTLSLTAKENLRLSQRQWLDYRDKEFNFISTFYYEEMQGTMWIVVAAGNRMDIVKQRALELKAYYDTLTND